jgi:hypothetical protein
MAAPVFHLSRLAVKHEIKKSFRRGVYSDVLDFHIANMTEHEWNHCVPNTRRK